MGAYASHIEKTIVIEHLDPELGPWSAAEYECIAKENEINGWRLVLSLASRDVDLPVSLQESPRVKFERRSVEEIFEHGKERVCLLDPTAEKDLGPDDLTEFDAYLFGGILGDDPPRDRTSELRNKGFARRRLGPRQMTTDTAARVTRMIIHDQIPLEQIPYVDSPEFQIDEHESVKLPFRYVKGNKGQPVMPLGMLELIKEDSNKGFQELF